MLFLDKGGMGFNQQLTSMVSVLGSKEIMLGYVSGSIFKHESMGIFVYILIEDFLFAEQRGEVFYQQPLEL